MADTKIPPALPIGALPPPLPSASRSAAPPPPPPLPPKVAEAPAAQYTGQGQPPSSVNPPNQVGFPTPGLTQGPGATDSSVRALKGLPGVQSAWVGKFDSNRQGLHKGEAAVIVPQGLDYSKEVKVLTYFHGFGGSISNAIAPPAKGAFGPELMEWAKKNNAVIVMPQGPAQDGALGAKDTWMSDPGQFANFTREALGKLDGMLPANARIGSVELVGHSAGGVAVGNALKGMADGQTSSLAGGRWKEIPVTGAKFLDASYSDQNDPKSSNRAEVAYSSLRKINPQAGFQLNYIANSMTDKKFSGNVKAYEQSHPGLTLIPADPGVVHETVPLAWFKKH